MKVLFLASAPPTACGVGDYTHRLREALTDQGVETRVEAHDRWTSGVLGPVLQAARWADVVHVQYPTVDFKTSLVPLVVLALAGKPTVVTVHEYSQAHPLRQKFVEAMCRLARRVVLVEAQEQRRLMARLPALQHKFTVIPIGSNIPRGQAGVRPVQTLVHFGLIRPERGLETFLQVAGYLQDWKVQVIGQVQQGQESYFRDLQRQSEAAQVEWVVGLGPEKVADLLAATTFAYLPFPDGASPRRGSLLACLLNGVCCVTTSGLDTPVEFAQSMRFARTPDEAVEQLQKLAGDPADRTSLIQAAEHHASQLDWASIARAHVLEYEKVKK